MFSVNKIYVFQKRQSTKNNVKVYGPVSNSSVLNNKEKNYFELVSKLNFTNEVYPFIAYLEKNDLDSFSKERFFFNLKEFNELKNVKVGDDDKLVLDRQNSKVISLMMLGKNTLLNSINSKKAIHYH